MSNCKHFPDADDICHVCANVMELHVLTINLPNDEIDFPAADVRTFTEAKAVQDYADHHHPLWTSMVIVATPAKKPV